MARIRTIKPEFPQSESMGRVSREARLLFIMLWTIVDDAGRTRAASRMLASVLYPYDDDAKRHIGAWLAELVREGCIRLYEVEGASYLQIENWLDHQKIDKPSKSRLPEPSSIIVASPREDSTNTLEPSATDLVPSTGPSTKDLIDQPRASRFGDFWDVCPKKVGKGKATALFDKACRENSPDLIIAAMQRYAASRAGEDQQFTKHPATWLSQKCWDDEGTGPPTATAEVISIRSAFESQEELEGQRRAMERVYGQTKN